MDGRMAINSWVMGKLNTFAMAKNGHVRPETILEIDITGYRPRGRSNSKRPNNNLIDDDFGGNLRYTHYNTPNIIDIVEYGPYEIY